MHLSTDVSSGEANGCCQLSGRVDGVNAAADKRHKLVSKHRAQVYKMLLLSIAERAYLCPAFTHKRNKPLLASYKINSKDICDKTPITVTVPVIISNGSGYS